MADLEKVASDLNSASQSLQELREKYDGALDLLDSKNTEITGALYSAKSNALQEVQTASNTATSQISQLKDTSLNAVNEAKNTATSEISSKKEEALEEFSQATSEFNSTKEEALSQIEQAKTEQGEKITALGQAKAEQESSITELKESVSTQGQKITEIEENNTAQGEKITALEQAKESITADLNKKPKLLTENLEWTVGSGKETDTHFNTLEKAIIESSKYHPANGYNFISITLKTGWVWDKPILIPTGSDLSFVKIFSESENECVVNNVFLRGSECTTPYIGVKLNCSQKDAKIQFSRSKIRFLNVIKIDNIRRIDFSVCELEIDGGEINFINNDEDPATFVFERCFGYIFSRIKIDYDYTAKDVFGFLIHNSSGKILMNADLSININATSNSNISGFGFSRTTLDIDAVINSTTNFTTNCLGVLYSLVLGTILNTHQKIVMNGSEKNIVFLIDKGFNVANIYDPEKITLNQSRYTNITPGQLSNTGQFITPK
ncbi:coiled-coil domain-containing protein, partial [Campylobacter jejuni]|uniref:coiled-coil domain-containing protein n=1 Tax=Campylobacter jejuni TaxID=197 RepID=UPI003F4927D3